jgi:hypothetical protein
MRRNHCQMAEAVHGDEVLVLDADVGKFADLPGHLDLELLQRFTGEPGDPVAALTHRLPDRFGIGAKPAQTTQSSDDNASVGDHLSLWP